MNEWEELVAGVLLGTERRALAPPKVEGPLGSALGAIGGSGPLAALTAAALLAPYRRAGWTPTSAENSLGPASPDETHPVCNSVAANHLSLMLQGQFKDALPEWLAALARAGRIVAPELLPELLEIGRRDRSLRPAILAVIGQRGRWLAAQNPEWDYSADALTAEDWETGSREARAALLVQLRSQDPEAARALLGRTWAQEPSDDRVQFIGLLAVGLSPADEPFLEPCLDDRRKEVRGTAADLLAALPGSALARRMVARVRPLLTLKKVMLIRTVLEVSLPEACDATMQRDGIDPKPPAHLQIGEKAWWLWQLLARTPLRHWESLGVATREVIDLAWKTEWFQALLAGWGQAAVRQRNVAWVELILERRPDLDELGQDLVRTLPASARERHALRFLGQGPLQGDSAALQVLNELHEPWSHALARAFMAALRQRAATTFDYKDWPIRAALKGYAYYFPPELLAEAEQGWPAASPEESTWTRAVADFLTILQFRRDMLQEISR